MNALASLVICAGLLLGSAAQAQYLNMLATTPLSQFNAADNKLFTAAIDKALTDAAEGVPIAWKNERSPAEGVVTLQRSFTSGGMACRELLIANRYKTLKGEGVHAFCKNAAGQWKLKQ